ncbi:MAG: hypothetical protein NTY77_18615 [Elusimicrobia bacterium]|nr:hypothetical protein [Elusimicrobiota bacterium]
MLNKTLILALMMGVNPAQAEPQSAAKIVDAKTFLKLIVPAAKKNFASYRGQLIRLFPDGKTGEGQYQGTLHLRGAQECTVKVFDERSEYSCAWEWTCPLSMNNEPCAAEPKPHCTVANTDCEIVPVCESAFKTLERDIRQSLGAGWSINKESTEDRQLKLVAESRSEIPTMILLSMQYQRDRRYVCNVDLNVGLLQE